jgi:hypothetical protein
LKAYDVPSLIESDPASNITDLLVDRARATPDLPLYAIESNGEWHDISAAEFLHQVKALAKGFIAAGIAPGQAVAIMSHTSYQWTLVDFALWFAGAVPVPIYETSSPSQMSWILTDSQAVAVFLETPEMETKLAEIRSQSAFLREVWGFYDDSLDRLVEMGQATSDELLEQHRTASGLDSLATIIYTSGTTGRPKGCELLHRGFVDLSKNAKLEIPDVLEEGQSTLLFLPLAHVFARFVEVLTVHSGVKVGHQGDVKNLAAAMVSFKPNFLLAVPRVFEKVYNTAEQKAEADGKGNIFRTAADVAVRIPRPSTPAPALHYRCASSSGFSTSWFTARFARLWADTFASQFRVARLLAFASDTSTVPSDSSSLRATASPRPLLPPWWPAQTASASARLAACFQVVASRSPTTAKFCCAAATCFVATGTTRWQPPRQSRMAGSTPATSVSLTTTVSCPSPAAKKS